MLIYWYNIPIIIRLILFAACIDQYESMFRIVLYYSYIVLACFVLFSWLVFWYSCRSLGICEYSVKLLAARALYKHRKARRVVFVTRIAMFSLLGFHATCPVLLGALFLALWWPRQPRDAGLVWFWILMIKKLISFNQT